MYEKDSNEWDIKVPAEGELEDKLRYIERQLAGQGKEFIFVLDLEGKPLYRAKGTASGIPNTKELQELLLGRQVIVITHNHPSGDATFSLADLDTFFRYTSIHQLRLTTGEQTAILEQNNRQKNYLRCKYLLTNEQKKLVRMGMMSQEEYFDWEHSILPVDLCKHLALDITLITL